MTRGYFCVAQGAEYIRHAYALALSLKISQSKVNKLSIGVTPGAVLEDWQKEVFDQVIEIPWSDLAALDGWKLRNEWKAIHMTPYDETIKLDADMLFFDDISDWWDELAKSDMVFATNATTYREEIITSDHCRKVFTINELPNVYSAFMFFKKTKQTYEFFSLAEQMFMHWPFFADKFLQAQHRPEDPTTDVVYAMCAKYMDIQELNNCTVKNFPLFTHMKSELQNWKDDNNIHYRWTKNVPYYFTPDCRLKIGNFEQRLPFHYHEKSFLTSEIISYLRKKAGYDN